MASPFKVSALIPPVKRLLLALPFSCIAFGTLAALTVIIFEFAVNVLPLKEEFSVMPLSLTVLSIK